MTAASYTEDLTDIITDFASTTGWTAIGTGGAGLNAPETDYYIQGNNCISKNAFASSTKGMIYDSGSDQGGSGTDGAYLVWLTHNAPNSLDTRSLGGMRFLIGSSTSAYNEYYVGGSDIQEFMGWRLVAVKEQNANWNGVTGSPSTTVEQTFGALWDLPSGGPTKGAPNGIDAIRYGLCTVTITNGTAPDAAASFDGIIASTVEDGGTGAGNRHGLLTLREPGGAFENTGKISFGTSGTQVRFTDSDKFIFARWHPHVTKGFHTWTVNNASTVLTLTNVALQQLESPGGFSIARTSFTVNNNATVTLTGCSFINCGEFSFDTNTTADGCTFLRCGSITHGGADTRNSIVSDHHVAITNGQDETSYDSSPATEGSFSGGTGYAVSDTILMQDGTVITVDAVTGGLVTQFTVDSTGAGHSTPNTPFYQERTSGSGVGFTLAPNVDNFPESASLVYNLAADPDGELDNMTFTQGDADVHAIDFGTSVTSDITLRGIAFNGFDSTANSKGATLRFLATSGSINCNLVGCTVDGNPATTSNVGVDDAAGISVTLVVDPVTTKVTTLDVDGNAVTGVRVFLETADNGGGSGFPFEAATSTLTQTGGTATLTASAAHGLATNDYVVVRGASDELYNKVAQITVTSTTQFTYSVDAGASASAGGTPIFSYVGLYGTSAGSPATVQSSKTWPASQGLKGWARKSTSSPYYKQAPLSIADASGGSDINALMILDE